MTDPERPDVQREDPVYAVRIAGHLDGSWSEWFDGLRIAPEPDGTTLITGVVRDAPALHGLLNRVRDTGLQLISVNAIDRPSDGPPHPDDTEQT